ncbi:MbnP family protein [Phaeodactylibacter luteus]|uniref:Copper-binding protein MbnP-like domain-containing protein n=1 Tax=Phaeodactylibacter luteus TaxID=1564516 RepID=A0A5C6S651_9BACT|nr:MbnP family protein [Phaeodactylibacter luteus]TXB69481.1 hypothetical protein FRY97_01340 [Phaeodactylibacter luteus]
MSASNAITTSRLAAALALLALAFGTGCYEPETGCLDVEAVNYSFSADEADPATCTYPELRLQFQHLYSEADTVLPFRLNDGIYTDMNGQPFRVGAFTFYVSELRLLKPDGSGLIVEDRLDIYVNGPNGQILKRNIEDNFALASPATASAIEMGTLRSSGTLSGISFKIGIDGQTNLAIADSIPLAHPLGVTDTLLYFGQDSGYVYQYIELFRDTTAADTLPVALRIGTFDNLVTLQQDMMVEKVPGFHFRVLVNIDYSKWLSGIDVANDSPAALAQKIVANTAEAFTIAEIVLEDD